MTPSARRRCRRCPSALPPQAIVALQSHLDKWTGPAAGDWVFRVRCVTISRLIEAANAALPDPTMSWGEAHAGSSNWRTLLASTTQSRPAGSPTSKAVHRRASTASSSAAPGRSLTRSTTIPAVASGGNRNGLEKSRSSVTRARVAPAAAALARQRRKPRPSLRRRRCRRHGRGRGGR